VTPLTFLSLGSNLGNRLAHLQAALDHLRAQLTIVAVSSVYETAPVGVVDQPAFLNAAAEIETCLSPLSLLALTKEIEQQVGRRETFRWGPRAIDIDILLYNDLAVETPELSIPHAEMLHRAFVLIPLAEIAPGTWHPVSGQTIQELSTSAPGKDGVKLTRLLLK
jgi:2-amino-4-hydroxy-6-hydroxymethyldihydropteridine diphosphokinase